MTDVADENERARLASIERTREVRRAYLAVFGSPELSANARIVLADLDRFCTTFRESIHMDAQGRMDPYTTIYRDGKKAVALRIRQMLEWSDHGNSNGNPDDT